MLGSKAEKGRTGGLGRMCLRTERDQRFFFDSAY